MDIKYLSPLLLAYEDRMKDKDERAASLQVGWEASQKGKVCEREARFKPGGNVFKIGIPISWQVLKCLLQEGREQEGVEQMRGGERKREGRKRGGRRSGRRSRRAGSGLMGGSAGTESLPDRQPSVGLGDGVQRRQLREVLLPWVPAAADGTGKRDIWADGEGRRPAIFQANLMFLNFMKSQPQEVQLPSCR